MLQLAKKTYYAVEAVLYIAYNTTSDPVSSREIADKQDLPPRYLEQIMQKLVRAGILRGVRGPRGGYLLARERRRIHVREICEVVQELETEELLAHSTALGHKVIFPLCDELVAQLFERLENVTLADLCDQAKSANIRRTADEPTDFMI